MENLLVNGGTGGGTTRKLGEEGTVISLVSLRGGVMDELVDSSWIISGELMMDRLVMMENIDFYLQAKLFVTGTLKV